MEAKIKTKKQTKNLQKKNRLTLSLVFVVIFSVFFTQNAYAVWNGQPYNAGQTLDPECSPTNNNCTVNLPSGNVNLPVTPAEGGTGMTSYHVGDLLYASGTTTLAPLSIGANGSILKVSAGALQWGSLTLQDVYNSTGGNTVTTTAGKDVLFNLANTLNPANFIINLLGQGDFVVKKNGTAFATFSHDGTVSLTGLLNLSADGVSVGGDTITKFTGAGLKLIAGVLSLDNSGDWAGTFGGHSSSYYLSRANQTGTQTASTISDFNSATDTRFNTDFAGKTTDNLTEGSTNFYFTNNRFDTRLATKTSDNVAEGLVNFYFTLSRFNTAFATKTTDNLTEGSSNLYYTNSRFNSSLAAKTTDNLTEGSTNKYYTDARARGAISSSATGLSYNSSTGAFALAAGYAIPTTASQTNWDSAYSNRITSATGPLAISNNAISLSTGAGLSVVGGVLVLDNTGDWAGTFGSHNSSYYLSRANQTGTQTASTISDFNSATDARFNTDFAGKTTDNLTEGITNLYYTNSRFNSSLAAKTTDNLTEGSTNKYYTDARARGSISSSATGLSYDSSTGIFTLSAGYAIPTTAAQTNWDSAYTNRITSANGPLSIASNAISLSTGAGLNVVGGALVLDNTGDWAGTFGGHGSSYYLSRANQTGTQTSSTISDFNSSVDTRFNTDLGTSTTDNLAEGTSNLYYTNGRFDTRFGTKTTDDLAEGLSNLYYTDGRVDTRFNTDFAAKTTDNLTEGSTNKYYTNARARGSISSSATGLSYNSATGIFTLAAGYAISTTASQTNWDSAYTNRITSATGPLSIASNAISITQADATHDGYISSTDWNRFNSSATVPSLTAGSVVFWNGTGFADDNANLYWDSTNHRLGIGTTTPTEALSVNGNIAITGNIVPTADNLYSLGSATNKWKDVYIGPGSLYIDGNEALSLNGSSDVKLTSATDKNVIIEAHGAGNVDLNPNGTGSVIIRQNVLLTGGKNIGTSDHTPVLMSDGLTAGNVNVTGNLIQPSNTDGSLQLAPNGAGKVYVSAGNFALPVSSYLNFGATEGTNGYGIHDNAGTLQYKSVGDSWVNFPSSTAISNWNTASSQSVSSWTTPLQFLNGVASITKSDTTHDGYLSSTDWNTFNGKQAALGFTPVTNARTISTTGPLTGGGALSSNLTLSMPAATTVANGYLTSTDWNTFNNKGTVNSVGGASGSSISVVGGTNVTISNPDSHTIQIDASAGTPEVTINGLTNSSFTIAGTTNQVNISSVAPGTITLSLPQSIATSSSPTFSGLTLSSLTLGSGTGILKATAGSVSTITDNSSNWNTAYNNQITSASAPLTLGGSSGAHSLTISQAGSGANGYLSSSDWNTFNNKVSSQWTSGVGNISYSLGNVGVGTSSPGSALDVKGTLRLSGATSGYVGFAPAAAAGSTTYTLPSADGATGQMLSTDGNGVLSWATPASGAGEFLPLAGGTMTGALLADNGSAGTPGIAFAGDTGTGLFNSATGILNFATGGSERMRIDASGNVGIGTTSPGSALDLNGTMRFDGATSGYVGLHAAAAAGSTTYTLPSADGSSGAVLSTNGSGVMSWTNSPTLSLANGKIFVGNVSGNAAPVTMSGDATISNAGALTLANSGVSANTYRSVTVDAKGRVTGGTNPTTFSGYGISDSSANLASALTDETGSGAAVFGTSPNITTPTISTSATVPLVIGGTGATSALQLRSTSGTGTSDAIIFQTGTNGATESMRIDHSGNLGVGTTAPGSKLDVKGTLRLSGATSGYVGFAPAADAGSTTYTLPTGDGATGQMLSTDGNGVLSWQTPASGSGTFLPLAGGTMSGALLLNNGTNATTPALAFAGDTGTGIFSTAAGLLEFGTSGAEAMRIDGSGHVGIGTTAPANALDVNGGAAIGTYAGSAGVSNGLVVSGNVGIGTASPGSKLDVSGTVRSTSQTSPASGTGIEMFYNSGSGVGELLSYNRTGSSYVPTVYDASYHAFYNSGSEAMRITGSKVGIATTSPGSALDVKGTIRLSGATSGYVGFAPAAAAGSTTYTLPSADGSSGQCLSTNGSGTLSWAACTVAGTVTGAGSTGYVPYWSSSSGLSYDSTSGGQFYWDSTNHRLGLGTASPSYLLDVRGNSEIARAPSAGGTGYSLVMDETGNNYVGLQQRGSTAVGNMSLPANSSELVSTGSALGIYTYTGNAYIVFGTGTTNSGETERMRITGAGNVGINTASPGSTLDVKGTLRLSGSSSGYVGFAPAAAAGSTTYTLPSADGTSGYCLSTNGSGTLSWASCAGGGSLTGSGSAGAIAYWGGTSALTQDASNLFWDSTNHRLGIGTTTPSYPLQVNGVINSTSGGFKFPDGTIQTTASQLLGGGWVNSGAVVENAVPVTVGTWITLDLSPYVGANQTLVLLQVSAPTVATNPIFRPNGSSATIGYTAAANDGAGSSGCTVAASATCFVLLQTDSSGKVQYTSSAANSTWTVTLVGFAAPSSSYSPSVWSLSGSNAYFTTGNVGIGTASPSYLLDAVGSGSGTLDVARLQNTVTAANNSGAEMLFAANRTTGGLTNVAAVSGVITDITNGSYKGALVFSTANNGAPSERMRIDNAGNVGIGTSSPGSTLDVKGTLHMSGATSGYVGFAPAAAAGSTTYTLPSADGSSGNVLSTNGAGTLSWAAGLTSTLSNGKILIGNGSNVATAVTPSGDATIDNTGVITLANSGVSASTYRSVTVDAKGRVTGGTNPTTFSGYGLSDTSANLAAALTDETGSGLAVFGTSPTIGTPTFTGAIRLNGATSGYTSLQSAAAPSANVTYTLPTGDGTSGYCLSTNGSGTLSWTSCSGGGGGTITGTGSAGAIPYWSGSSSLSQDASNFYWDSTNHRLGVGTTSPLDSLEVYGGNASVMPTASAGLDPYTVLNLHGDSTFADASSYGQTMTNHNSATISATKSEFGGASMHFTRASNQYITGTNASGNFSFGTGDFTIDAWINLDSLPASGGYPGSYWIFGGGPSNSNPGFDFYITNTNLAVSLSNFGAPTLSVAHGFSTGVWYHIAVVRQGNNIYLFKNGALLGSGTTSETADPMSTGYAIGAAEPSGATSGNFDGYIDELRVSKGIARWTSTFTPPSSAYSAGYGYLGVGTTTHTNNFDVFGAGALGTYAGVNTAPANGLIVSGNVGIGTSSPALKLAVNGTIGAPGTSGAAQTGVFRLQGGETSALDMGLITGGGGAWLQSTDASNLATNNKLLLNPNGGSVNVGTTSAYVGQLNVNKATSGGLGGDIWITNSGTNAVGSSARLAFAPDSNTDSIANAGIEDIMTGSTTSDLAFKIYDGSGYNEKVRFTSTGYIGVGTTGPAYRVDAANSGTGIVDVARWQNTLAAANNSGAEELFAANRTTGGLTNVAAVAGIITDITNGAYKGALVFSTANNAAPAERMRIDNAGNVGINQSSPGSALDVKGTLRLSGATSGYVGFAPAAAAGSTTYTLPSSDGTSGYCLSTNGSGTLSWTSCSGGGGSITGSGAAGYVPYWSGASALSYDNTSSGQFYWDSTNHRLGIGTATPSDALTVNGVLSLSTGSSTPAVTTGYGKIYATSTAIGGNDANTKLLLHADGSGTSFTDSSADAATVTAHGSATQSTAQAKFGPSSAVFTGTAGDYLTVPNNADYQFGSGDFTVDTWVRVISYPNTYSMIFSKRGSSSNLSGMLILLDTSGRLLLFAHSTGGSWNLASGTILATGVTTGTWHHIAVTRSGNTWTGYVDGTPGTPQTIAGTLDDNGSALTIGGEIDGSFILNGYIDEYRITKGLARWTTNFTVPAGSYGNSSYSLNFEDPVGTVSTVLGGISGGANWVNNGTKLYYSSGNVGIGTSDPSYLLDTAGSGSGTLDVARLQNTVTAANNSGAEMLFAANRTTGGLTNVAAVSGLITDITNGAYKGALVFSTANNAAPAERMRIDNAGNVGIGTTSPANKLEVTGGQVGIDYGSATAQGQMLRFYENRGANANWVGASIDFLNPQINYGGGFAFSVHPENGTNNGTLTTAMAINYAGNVGIGTTSPGAKLSVIGNGSGLAHLGTNGCGGNFAGLTFGSSVDSNCTAYSMIGEGTNTFVNAPTGGTLYFRIGNTDKMTVLSGGSVGIGDASPASTLVVRKDASGARGAELSLVNMSGGTNAETAINFGVDNSTYNADAPNAQIKAINTNGGGNNGADLVFSTWNGSAWGERMRIQSGGNVGIGSTNPSSAKLVVSGTTLTSLVTGTDTGYIAHSTQNSSNTASGSIYESVMGSTGITIWGASHPNIASLELNSTSGGYFGNRQNAALNLGTNDAVRVTIDANGLVGIGTTAPASKLDILPTGSFAAAGVSDLTVRAHTVTLTGANPTTYATFFTDQIGAMTLVGTNASQTVTDAAGLNITSAPVKSTNVALTNTYGLLISAGAVSTATNSYGLTVNAQTGATNNYAAVFLGGNVGIGTASPALTNGTTSSMLDIEGTNNPGIAIKNNTASNVHQYLMYVMNSSPNALVWYDATNNANRMALDSSGNLGIGTTSPVARLQVKQSSNAYNSGLTFTRSDTSDSWSNVIGGDNAYYIGYASNGTSYSDRFMMTSAGLMGIGTTAPAAKLDVVGTVRATTNTTMSAGTGTELLYDGALTRGLVLAYDRAGSAYKRLDLNDLITLSGGATGSVGINMTSPGYKFDVASSGSGTLDVARLQNTVTAANNSGAEMLFAANRTTGGLTNVAAVSGLITDITNGAYKGALVFSTASNAAPAERMRIDDAGKVAIGGTTMTSLFNVGSSAQFQVNSSGAVAAATGVTSSGTITFSGLNNAGAVLFTNSSGVVSQDTTAGGQFYWDSTNHRLGIGTNTPSNPLEVGTDGTNGNGAYVSIGGTWTNGSSVDFKENFTTLDSQDVLKKIDGLSIQEWNYKIEGAGVKHIGPTAEEFFSTFGVGNDNKHISTIDPAGVALLGIQGLSQNYTTLEQAMSDMQEAVGQTIDQQTLLDAIAQKDGVETMLDAIRDEQSRSAIVYIGDKITAGFKPIEDFVSARVTAIQGYFTKIHSDQLCLNKADGSEVCVNGDELANILSAGSAGTNNSGSTTVTTGGASTGTPTTTTGGSGTTTTTTPTDIGTTQTTDPGASSGTTTTTDPGTINIINNQSSTPDVVTNQ